MGTAGNPAQRRTAVSVCAPVTPACPGAPSLYRQCKTHLLNSLTPSWLIHHTVLKSSELEPRRVVIPGSQAVRSTVVTQSSPWWAGCRGGCVMQLIAAQHGQTS